MARYTTSGAVRGVVLATVIAGTLDILSAFVFAAPAGSSPLRVLGGVGSAIVSREAIGNPWTMAVIGLALHFAIMAVMVFAYFVVASGIGLVNRLWVASGVGYGFVLWGIMYWAVLPHRWPTLFPITDPGEVAQQWFSHVALVGLPIAWVACMAARWHDIASDAQ